MVERILASSEFWTAVSAALVTLIGSWGLAYFKIRRAGIDSYNAAEITDRAKFREHIIHSLEESQAQHADCLRREMELRIQIGELTARLSRLEGNLNKDG